MTESINDINSYLVNDNRAKWFEYAFDIFDVFRKNLVRNEYQVSTKLSFSEYLSENSFLLSSLKEEVIQNSIYEINKYLNLFTVINEENMNIIKLNNWFIENAEFFGDIRNLNENQFDVLILEQMKTFLTGNWNDLKKNFNLCYFLTYLIENPKLYIPNKFEGNRKQLYLEELNGFLQSISKDTTDINSNKFINLIKIWENLNIISITNDGKRVFANPKFNQELMKYTSLKFLKLKGNNRSIEDFLFFIDSYIFPITYFQKKKSTNIFPDLLGNLILCFNGKFYVLEKIGGDFMSFKFPNGRNYKTIKISDKK